MTRLPEIADPQRKAYPSDLSDAEWEILKPLLPAPKGFGHPVEVDLHEILNGIFYVQRTGCQWEMILVMSLAYFQSTLHGYEINKHQGQKYVCRPKESRRMYRRRSTFGMGLDGENWVKNLEQYYQEAA